VSDNDGTAEAPPIVPSTAPLPRLGIATRSAEALGVTPEDAAYGTRIALESGDQLTRHFHTFDHFEQLGEGGRTIGGTLISRGVIAETADLLSNAYWVAARDHDVVYTTLRAQISAALT
jgi:hypothetical protein